MVEAPQATVSICIRQASLYPPAKWSYHVAGPAYLMALRYVPTAALVICAPMSRTRFAWYVWEISPLFEVDPRTYALTHARAHTRMHARTHHQFKHMNARTYQPKFMHARTHARTHSHAHTRTYQIKHMAKVHAQNK